MRVAGLVMAGGAGTRMQRSGSTCPKPLVTVRGRSLLEHNVRAMLASGVNQITVSVRSDGAPIRQHAIKTCGALVAGYGGKLNFFVEDKPLGNIGCLSVMKDTADTVVISYADNLTALKPTDLLNQHLENSPALTLAAHYHTFQMPFGELVTSGRAITGYTEKPRTQSLVCSALCIAGPEAMAILPDDQPTGLSQLTTMLIQDDCLVESFEHSAPWIDVNDVAAIDKAEQLIADQPHDFDWFIEDITTKRQAA